MDNESGPGPLGAKLAELRTAAGLSLYQLEKQSGIDRPKLMRLESGHHKNPTTETLNRLAAALGVDPEELYDLAAATGPLPSLPTYFRSKYGLTDRQIKSLERTVGRMTDTPHSSATETRTRKKPTKKGGTS